MSKSRLTGTDMNTKRIHSLPLFLMAACSFMALTVFSPNAGASGGVDVLNVKFESSGGMITISYDLQAPADREYAVRITLRRKQNSSYVYTPISLKGDCGEGAFSGSNKKVTWDFFKEFPQGLDGDDFYFTVRVEMLPQKGSNTWLYIGGGAIIAGGAAAAILLSGGSKESGGTTTEQGYPKPLGRPGTY